MSESSLATQRQRIEWVDSLRGLTILLILYYHTEIYYAGDTLVPYNLFANRTLLLFFLSGYVFLSPGKPLSCRHKLHKIVVQLLWPYFLFTSLIAIPKALLNETPINFENIIWPIITGRASWFVMSLLVARLIYMALLQVCREKLLPVCGLSVLSLLLAYFYGNLQRPDQMLFPADLFCISEAFLVLPILCCGSAVRFQEQRMAVLFRWSSLCVITVLMLATKYYIYITDASICLGYVSISNLWLFIVDAILTTLFFVVIMKRLPSTRILQWFGRHSLVVYFLCGAIPHTIAWLLTRFSLPFGGSVPRLFFAFLLVVGVCAVAVIIIYRWLPWSIGQSREVN